jgi:hypothetical protein
MNECVVHNLFLRLSGFTPTFSCPSACEQGPTPHVYQSVEASHATPKGKARPTWPLRPRGSITPASFSLSAVFGDSENSVIYVPEGEPASCSVSTPAHTGPWQSRRFDCVSRVGDKWASLLLLVRLLAIVKAAAWQNGINIGCSSAINIQDIQNGLATVKYIHLYHHQHHHKRVITTSSSSGSNRPFTPSSAASPHQLQGRQRNLKDVSILSPSVRGRHGSQVTRHKSHVTPPLQSCPLGCCHPSSSEAEREKPRVTNSCCSSTQLQQQK